MQTGMKQPSWPVGGGTMGALIRAHDWSRTPLGPIQDWPQSLKTAIGIMLTTRHPVFIFWGADLTCLYNDAYAASLGPEKHPSILGMPASKAWPEAYSLVAAELQQVMAGGEATWRENHLVPISRHGRIEEVYWTYSYGQIHDTEAPNGVGGVLALITETTQTVVSQRESEAKYRTLFESIDEGLCIVQLVFDEEQRPIDYRYIEINPAFEQQTGVKDALGKSIRELVPDIEPFWFDIYGKVALTGEATRFIDHSRSMGRWFDVYAFRIGHPDERCIAVLCNDISERKRAEEEVRESEARFRNMADHAPVMIWVSDSNGLSTYVNLRWSEFTGQNEAEAAGLGWLAAIHPDDRANLERTWSDSFAARAPLRLEARLRRSDGVYRWVFGDGLPRFGPNGAFLGYIGSVIDIDERREAEQRQALLAREVDHRARNALAVVQALVRLTRAERPDDFQQAVESRVAALARAHGLLARNRWTGADLHTLVSEELAPYLGPANMRVSFTGPAVMLVPDAVQPMGMVLHELATNAAKHGALSMPEGRIEVKWAFEREGVRLEWREMGGPPVSGPPTRQGFGSQVIEGAADQLGGKAARVWDKAGLCCVLTLGRQSVVPENRAPQATPDAKTLEAVPGRLKGRHILLVEDDAVLAVWVRQSLQELGCIVVGPAGTLGEALRLSADAPKLDAAVLDVNLKGQEVWPAAEFLEKRGVPRLYITGYGDVVASGDSTVLQKPVAIERLTAALASMIGVPGQG